MSTRRRFELALLGEACAPHVRSEKPVERPTIQLTDGDYLAATGLTAPTSGRSTGRLRSAGCWTKRTLIDELWRISHFGWIPEAAIRRALTLAGGHEIPNNSLHQGLRQLLECGYLELQGASLASHRLRPTRPLQLRATEPQQARLHRRSRCHWRPSACRAAGGASRDGLGPPTPALGSAKNAGTGVGSILPSGVDELQNRWVDRRCPKCA